MSNKRSKPSSKKGAASTKGDKKARSTKGDKKAASIKGDKKARKKREPKEKVEFGISIGEVFRTGMKGYFTKDALYLTLAGIPVFVTLAIFIIPWRNFNDSLDDRIVSSLGTSNEITEIAGFDALQWVALLLVGFVPAGAMAFAWFSYALDVADGREIDVRAPFVDYRRIGHHFVASFWFWAGITLGLRYLAGIPSILVLVLYAFYGYVIADRAAKGGMRALGTSVRLGERRRIGIFAIAALFFAFNLIGILGFAVGLEDGSPSVLGVVLGILGLSATGSITLISGAKIYRVLEGKLHG